MLNIALVEYINTRPFLDGLEKFFKPEETCYHLLPPAQCAVHLSERNSQMALIPVGALPEFGPITLLPDFCIGANGEVASVFLFSQVPVDQLDTVILDRHSRTSNGLVKILLKYHWKKEVEFVKASEKHFDQITGSTGGVVIGDKAIKIRDQFVFAYDLSAAWTSLTGLPFAFAVWAYYPEAISAMTLDRIRSAMDWGVAHAKDSALKWAEHFRLPVDFAIRYLEHFIQFHFDAPKHRALRLYHDLLLQMEVPSHQRPLEVTFG